MVRAEDYDALIVSGRAVLDVRAPVEFERGALPAAVNLPLMDDAEREQVGIRYAQEGNEAATALGHSLVSGERRAARVDAWSRWCDAHPDGVVCCFRGGQRSQITQHWLHDAGHDRPRIEGGYKAVRSHLLARLEQLGTSLPLKVVGGRTGTGKTELLLTLPRQVDLEGLANHRGSAFGRRPQGQPAPADFENCLARDLLALADAPQTPVAIEDESRNVGRLSVPPALLDNMTRAPIALVEESLDSRVDTTLAAYVLDACRERQQLHGEEAGFDAFAEHLRDGLGRIRKRLGGVRHDAVSAALEDALTRHRSQGDVDAHRAWIAVLLVDYYDPMYDYQLEGKRERIVFRGDRSAVRDWLIEATRSP